MALAVQPALSPAPASSLSGPPASTGGSNFQQTLAASGQDQAAGSEALPPSAMAANRSASLNPAASRVTERPGASMQRPAPELKRNKTGDSVKEQSTPALAVGAGADTVLNPAPVLVAALPLSPDVPSAAVDGAGVGSASHAETTPLGAAAAGAVGSSAAAALAGAGLQAGPGNAASQGTGAEQKVKDTAEAARVAPAAANGSLAPRSSASAAQALAAQPGLAAQRSAAAPLSHTEGLPTLAPELTSTHTPGGTEAASAKALAALTHGQAATSSAPLQPAKGIFAAASAAPAGQQAQPGAPHGQLTTVQPTSSTGDTSSSSSPKDSGSSSTGGQKGSNDGTAAAGSAATAALAPGDGASFTGLSATGIATGIATGPGAQLPQNAGAGASGSGQADSSGSSSPIAGTESSAGAAINSAQVLSSMHGSEMRVGVHSSDFGSVSIATTVSREGLSAQIALGRGTEVGGLSDALSRALNEHLPALEEKLGLTLGLAAKVEVREAMPMQAAGSHTNGPGAGPDAGPAGYGQSGGDAGRGSARAGSDPQAAWYRQQVAGVEAMPVAGASLAQGAGTRLSVLA